MALSKLSGDEQRQRPMCLQRHSCNASDPAYTLGWLAFALPRGIYLRQDALSCVMCSPNAELGVSHARLPITHTRTHGQQLAAGLWFYYARGCSDTAWDVGRTVLRENRCDAAIYLAQRARRLGRKEAAELLAERLRAAAATLKLYNFDLEGIVAHAQRAMSVPGLTLAALVEECARGVYDPAVNGPGAPPAEPTFAWSESGAAPHAWCHGRCFERAAACSRLVGFHALDFVNEALLLELLGTAHELDTVQLLRQPQGGGSIRWATEIWDVRHVRTYREQLRRLNGSAPLVLAEGEKQSVAPVYWESESRGRMACPVEDSWAQRHCLACNNSQLQRACNFGGCSRAQLAQLKHAHRHAAVSVYNDSNITVHRA